MDGTYPSNNYGESIIESWMHTIIRDGGIDRHDDLHIDKINACWKDKNTWILAGLHVFDLALNIRDREQLPVSVVLGFALKSGIQPRHVNFRATVDLERELGETPPSLYLFRLGQEPWIETELMKTEDRVGDATIEKINSGVFGSFLRTKGSFYFEFRALIDEEYSRSILIAG